MSLLAVDLAIYERLVGAPLDEKGRPRIGTDGKPVNRTLFGPPLAPEGSERLPSWGVRIPQFTPGRSASKVHGTTSDNVMHPYRDYRAQQFIQVPVFPINIEGRPWKDVWPCVTFYWSDMRFNPETYMYADPIGSRPDDADTITVEDYRGGNVRSGKNVIRLRSTPDEYDAYYVIRGWAKSLPEMMWICKQIITLFPARTAIEVDQMDGTKARFDMLQVDSINLDTGNRDVPMAAEMDEQRSFSRAFIYKIESYVDNTINAFGQNDVYDVGVITQRILELADMQDQLVESPLTADTVTG